MTRRTARPGALDSFATFSRRHAGKILALVIAGYYAVTVLPLPNVNPFGTSRFEVTPEGAVRISSPGLWLSRPEPEPLRGDAFRRGGFAVELDVVPSGEPAGPARIISDTVGANYQNWLIGQEKHALVIRHRGRAMAFPDVFRTGEACRFLVRLEDDRVTLVDGDGETRTRSFATGFSGWHDDARVTMANEITGDRAWTGEIRTLRIHDSPAVSVPFLELRADSARLRLAGPGGVVELERVPWPWIRKIGEGLRRFPPKPRDVAANMLLTIPLGFFLGVRTGRRSLARALLAVTVVQVAVTLTAEAVQVFSLYRKPDLADLLSNLAGALAGLALARRLPAEDAE